MAKRATKAKATRNEDTAEAKATVPEKKVAADKQFAKADARNDPRTDKADGEDPAHTIVRMANSGF